MFRVLALRRRDLDIVAHVSPELLQPAVVKSFWMFEVRDRQKTSIIYATRSVALREGSGSTPEFP